VRWLMLLLTAILLTVALSLVGCRELGRAGQELEHGKVMQQAIKPPSGVVDDIVRRGGKVVQRVKHEGDDATAKKIEEWGGTALEEVIDKGPDAYDAYKELDRDLDGHWDSDDNCPDVFNPNQDSEDVLGPGDACDESENDVDSDSQVDALDNCPNVWNASQVNHDEYWPNGDEYGDACDIDMDADGVWNLNDSDMDGDGYRYEGDLDMDGDGYIYRTDLDNDADGVWNENDNFDWAPAYY
jgi:hypothetical protein